MLRILFLIFVLMSSGAFALAQQKSDKAYKFDEFGKVNNREFNERYNKFLIKLQNEEPTATGYIVNYGTASEIAKRELQIRDSVPRSCHHDCRIVIVNGGESKELKTVFWIVPNGDKPPDISIDGKPNLPLKATKFDDFGEVSDRYFGESLRKFSAKLNEDKNLKGVIINHIGTKENQENFYASMEEKLRNHPMLKELILENRISFIEGRAEEYQRTQLWIVPEGAELPKP